ncbi:peroxisomal multifunctional enzyme type 2-like [Argonauta hians]
MAGLRFDGQVVLITGAGNGLGRQYALAFAERGANVVVNDLGGNRTGVGQSLQAADEVVREIVEHGGTAVADYHSVEEGDRIVQTALDTYGKIDILVNNAGILRDRSFAKLTDEEWDIIQRVHLRGAYLVTHAAWPHMIRHKFGKIIMTCSAAGIYGNFGQSSYSAAKLGLLGFSNTLAIEGRKYNVQCNTIAPLANSRLTLNNLPEEFKPEYISPLVLYLCHTSCSETGGIFETGAGWISKLRWERSAGAVARSGGSITPESVRDNWDKICSFESSTNPESTEDSIVLMSDVLNENPCSETPMACEKNLNFKSETPIVSKYTYNFTDVILYALSVGMTTKSEGDLKYLYENHSYFSVLPTFSTVMAFKSLTGLLQEGIPGFDIVPSNVLHGEQYTEILKPLDSSGEITSYAKVVDVLDKGSGAIILLDVESFNEGQEKVVYNQFSIFQIGAGGFGGKRTSPFVKPLSKAPSHQPHAVLEEKTSSDQAAFHRLCGDYNPLHIDPSFAAVAGFQTPPLHGLCIYGFALRHVMKTFLDNDASLVKSIHSRFAKPFIPGQTLRTEMWKADSGIHFQCKIVENGNLCLSGGFVTVHDFPKNAIISEKQETNATELKGDTLFKVLATTLENKPQMQKINNIFLWNIMKDDHQIVSQWTLDLSPAGGGIYPGTPKGRSPQCILSSRDNIIQQLFCQQISPKEALSSGKLKAAGNVVLCQHLSKIFRNPANL